LNIESAAAGSLYDDNDHSPIESVRMDSDLLKLQCRLVPLLSMEAVLAERLNAGYHVDNDTGLREIFFRRGWQSIVPPLDGPRYSSDSPDDGPSVEADRPLFQTSALLDACKGDVKYLWDHPTVRKLIKRRKIIIKESSEMWVFSSHLPLSSVLDLGTLWPLVLSGFLGISIASLLDPGFPLTMIFYSLAFGRSGLQSTILNSP
jgi:hypothetical protein